MKLSKHQQGFAAVEAILIVIVLGIIGFTGWFVYHSKQSTDKTLNQASTTTQTAGQKKSSLKGPSYAQQSATQVAPASKAATITYLNVPEWGLKISFPDADKVTYTAPADEYNWNNIDHVQSVSLYLKSSVTSSTSCRDLMVKLYKFPDSYSADIYPHWTIDEGNNDAFSFVMPNVNGFGPCDGGSTQVAALRANLVKTELNASGMEAL